MRCLADSPHCVLSRFCFFCGVSCAGKYALQNPHWTTRCITCVLHSFIRMLLLALREAGLKIGPPNIGGLSDFSPDTGGLSDLPLQYRGFIGNWRPPNLCSDLIGTCPDGARQLFFSGAAARSNLDCLNHEKPLAGINGSGKCICYEIGGKVLTLALPQCSVTALI